MKKILLLAFVSFFSISNTFASIVDDSIEKELDKGEVKKKMDLDINLKSFKTCEDMEKVMGDYIKTYWKKNKDRWNYRRGGVVFETMNEDIVMDMAVKSEAPTDNSKKEMGLGAGASDDYSKTNTQVKGVDEADIVKTDGKYIYYFSEKNNNPKRSFYDAHNRYIYVVSATSKKLVKKIKIPANFNGINLYLNNNKLIIIATGYENGNYKGYYINRNSKTYTIVYDISNLEKLKLDKIYLVDGNYKNSRMIGDYVYLVSENNFNIPFYDFKNEEDIKINANKLIPKKLDLSYTKDKTKQNYKKYPYNLSTGYVANCNEIEYILPDEKSMEKYDFSPSYNIISVINTKNPSEQVQTKVLTTDNAEMYMSTDNIYLTSYLYNDYDFSCPPFARCIMPYYNRGENTLVHKFAINKNLIDYKKSTIVPGKPLTQYSMDEYKGDFRILTQTDNWEVKGRKKFTGLYILDENLSLKGKLENLGNGENFKSSKYIGDKLFLVTFKDIDPFFVIDVADSKNPKVLGELKMPGYSTYLHSYDENHIIGLGYDTFENKWGGTQNAGLKVDLYEINYDKKCGGNNLTNIEKEKCEKGDYKGIIAKQKFSQVFGGKGSYSEALDNPRMFMWNAKKSKLLLPTNLRDYDDENYENTEFFQGMLAIDINKNTGIKEAYRITNLDFTGIEKEMNKECEKYSGTTDRVCEELKNGEKYCYSKNNRKPPKYCFKDSTVWDYFNNKSWQFRDSFIKRALWISDQVFTISDDKVKSSNLETGKENYEVELD